MATRVADGARLYVDLVEINPPLVVWLNLPLVGLARAFGWSEIIVFRAAVWGVVAGALWLSHRVLRAAGADTLRRAGLMLGLVLVLATMPGPYFGQREHVALALMLPWFLLAGARAGRGTAGGTTSVVIGVLAAVGFALKPHYLLAAAGVAAYHRVTAPKAGRMPPEQLVVLALLLVYAGAVVVAAPEYLELVSRWGAVYWDYVRRPLSTILAGSLSPLTVIGSLCLWPLTRRLTPHRGVADVLGIATLGLFLAVILQHKGFGYHYYPALGTGLLGLLLGALGGKALAGAAATAGGRALAALAAAPAIALFLTVAVGRAGGSAERGPVAAGSREIDAFLQAGGAGGAVAILSPRMEDSFPLVLKAGIDWGSRYPFMWFVPALHRRELLAQPRVTCDGGSDMPPVEREILGTVAEDLRKHHPALIFVRKPGDTDLLRVDVLACLRRHPEFRRAFRAYRPVVELEHFRVFERVSS